jgi:signal transduction histidine kinase
VRAARVLCPPAGLKGCMTVVSYKVYQPDGIWLLYVAVPVVPWYGNSTALLLAIGASLLITAMVTAGTFRDLTKAMGPVNAIRRELAEITSTGLDRRVPVPRKDEEIKLLAETANDTLDRLEGAYQQLRRFTSDASHDLRSPITAMRAQLEEALMYPQDTDWPKMTKAVLAGVDRLQAIVTDLLTLARLDARAPLTRSRTDLGRLVGAELDRRTYGMEIVKDLRQNVFIDCDRLRIIRVLVNLLDNAGRHATSKITVIARADGTMATLEVLDDGAGIAPEHRERVFERFTRLEASRDRDAGGTGLGLAIAREIAEAHEGTLTIQDSERGACFVLRLPRVRSLSSR